MTVLVLGASGGIGVASVQLAKALGARMVIAGVLGDDNAKVARQAGADAVIDLGGADLRDALRERVHQLTGGHGADIVIDPVGGACQRGGAQGHGLARPHGHHRLCRRRDSRPSRPTICW